MSFVLLLPLLPLYTTGFSLLRPTSTNICSLPSSAWALEAMPQSRREMMWESVLATATAVGAGVVSWGGGNIQSVGAIEIDYSKIQDLLGSDAQSSSSSLASYAPTSGKRPTYLTEPTDDFKQNEAKAMEFKRQNLKRKQEFLALMDRFETVPNEEETLAGIMDDMRRFVRSNGGLPLGVSRQELVSVIRRRKAKKYWPTNVEIAYQDLLYEIQYQQSPNTLKDEENPL